MSSTIDNKLLKKYERQEKKAGEASVVESEFAHLRAERAGGGGEEGRGEGRVPLFSRQKVDPLEQSDMH